MRAPLRFGFTFHEISGGLPGQQPDQIGKARVAGAATDPLGIVLRCLDDETQPLCPGLPLPCQISATLCPRPDCRCRKDDRHAPPFKAKQQGTSASCGAGKRALA